jgi:hypothetical protein
VGGHHTFSFGGGGATVAIETPAVASGMQHNPKRKRRRGKRGSKSAKRARMAAEQNMSQDPTPPVAKTAGTDEDVIE